MPKVALYGLDVIDVLQGEAAAGGAGGKAGGQDQSEERAGGGLYGDRFNGAEHLVGEGAVQHRGGGQAEGTGQGGTAAQGRDRCAEPGTGGSKKRGSSVEEPLREAAGTDQGFSGRSQACAGTGEKLLSQGMRHGAGEEEQGEAARPQPEAMVV